MNRCPDCNCFTSSLFGVVSEIGCPIHSRECIYCDDPPHGGNCGVDGCGCTNYQPSRSPTAPPSDATEDARAWEDLAAFELNGNLWTDTDAVRFAEQYAAKQVERQTPAIIEEFVEEVEKHLTDEWYGEGIEAALKAMQTVKARQSKGEK